MFQAFNSKTKFQERNENIYVFKCIKTEHHIYFIVFTLYYIFQKSISINISTCNEHAARNIKTCIQLSVHAIIMAFMYFKKQTKSMIEEVVNVLHEGSFLLVHLAEQKLILLIHQFSD